jgi:hypothetical protein
MTNGDMDILSCSVQLVGLAIEKIAPYVLGPGMYLHAF